MIKIFESFDEYVDKKLVSPADCIKRFEECIKVTIPLKEQVVMFEMARLELRSAYDAWVSRQPEIDQIKQELEAERAKVERMRNSGNCSLAFTDSCPFYAYNQTNCPCLNLSSLKERDSDLTNLFRLDEANS